MKMGWTWHHTGMVVCLATKCYCYTNIQFITNARAIKAILKRKDILYCKLKITPAAHLFTV